MHGGYAKNIGAGASKVVLHNLGSIMIRIDNHYVLFHRILLSCYNTLGQVVPKYIVNKSEQIKLTSFFAGSFGVFEN